jgi:superfamily II DNA or RNA helicase
MFDGKTELVPSKPLELSYVDGTLELRGAEEKHGFDLGIEMKWDKRTNCLRYPAFGYSNLIRSLVRGKIPFTDNARRYEEVELCFHVKREPRPYQREAIAAWLKEKGQATIVLPTGAGKTQVALMAIFDRKRSALVVVPTLDLVRQWYDSLRHAFGIDVGVIGGGEYDLKPITVTTYDSAHLHAERLGNRFGLVVFDEVHHLPSPSYQLAARLSLAPYRLGLTATPERTDGQEALLTELVGPIAYRVQITELSGEYLAEYDTEKVVVELSEQERFEYDEARQLYLGFVRQQGIKLGSPRGWNDFVMRASRSVEGRRAFAAYRKQRNLAIAASAKIDKLDELLHRHRRDRSLIFTLDNATAYLICRRFLVPIITHHTKVKERSQILERFAEGRYGTVVTSKVLNEGVDVPDANVAIIVSGTGSVREHVQRLGRILRPRDGKRAVLYELVTGQTGEQSTSERRREHVAYRSKSC